MNGDCHILLRSDSETIRTEFKESCRRQGMTMTKAMNVLMGEVISGNIVLTQRAKMRKKSK